MMNDPPHLFCDAAYQISRGWPSQAPEQAAAGDVQALLYLALRAFHAGDQVSSLQYYERAASDQNSLEGALNAAKMYEMGMGCKSNLEKACQMMKQILEGVSESQLMEHAGVKQTITTYGWYMLGASTPKGILPQQTLPLSKQNTQEGVKWLEKAATEQGNGEVAGILGDMFMTGGNPKLPVDFPRGVALLEIAAKLGDGHRAHQLYIAYKIGFMIPVDPEKSRYWLKRSADLGFREAQQAIARGGNDTIPSFNVDSRKAKKEIRKLKREDDIVSLLTTDETRKCSNPQCTAEETASTGRFQLCVRCKHRKYCGKACQIAHWKNGHKDECRKLEATKEGSKQMNIDMIKNRMMATCVRCGNMECRAIDESGSFKKCGKCKQTRYCRRECQTAHWKAGHREECPKLEAKNREVGP